MFSSSSRKPYTAVTVHVERLTGPEYEENDMSGIVDLIEVIRIQDSGPAEAARAIRKKLKYGSADRQLRALTILDGLIENAGSRFQRTFADEALLERLRILPRDDLVDANVRKKCNTLFRQWAAAYQGVRGMESIATLYKQLPTKQRPAASQSKVIQETEREAAEDPFAGEIPPAPTPEPTRNSIAPPPPTTDPSSSSSKRNSHPPVYSASSIFGSSHSRKSSKNKNKPFNLEKEKPNMLAAIAGASVASTNLTNGLKLINRETHRVSDDQTCAKRFETCKLLRRQILRYIQLVESDTWIGSLLTANDELVNALMAYEIMDKSIDDDSDSDAELFTEAGVPIPPRRASRADDLGGPSKGSGVMKDLAGLKLDEAPPAKPPRPKSMQVPPPVQSKKAAPSVRDDSEEEGDDDDPFGDQNEIKG